MRLVYASGFWFMCLIYASGFWCMLLALGDPSIPELVLARSL